MGNKRESDNDIVGIKYVEQKGYHAIIDAIPNKFNNIDVGFHMKLKDAILARDMEMLRNTTFNEMEKLSDLNILNNTYRIRNNVASSVSSEDNSKGSSTLKGAEVEICGVWISISVENGSNYDLNSVAKKFDYKYDEHEKEPVFHVKSSGYVLENRSWTETITSSYLPLSNFVYEIAFNHSATLGLNLKTHFTYY